MVFDWIHLHLMVNHFPVVLSVMGAAVAVAALVRNDDAIWTYGAVTLILAGLFAPPAFLTGRQAESEAERAWFVTDEAIHGHEELAETAALVSMATAVAAVVALWRPKRQWRVAMAVLAVAAAVTMGLAALEGGEIVHDSPALNQGAPSGTSS